VALNKATPYLLTGAGVALCFRARIVNIGAEGQIALGGLAATWLALRLPQAPAVVLPVLCALAGAGAGAVWAGLAALVRLKRRALRGDRRGARHALGDDARGRARRRGGRHRGPRRPLPADRGLLAGLRLRRRLHRADRRAEPAGRAAGGALLRLSRVGRAGHAARGGRADAARLGHPGLDDDLRAGGDGAVRSASARVSVETALVELLAAAVRIATPLFFAALGGILSERAGVFAVGLEGMMLAGAFGGVLAGHLADSAAAGLAASVAAGVLLALLVAVATVRFGADQMVTGLAVNILAVGLTSFLLRGFAARGEAATLRVPVLAAWPVPGLAEVPVLGVVLFRQPPLTYAAVVFGVLIAVFLARTRAGLTLRAVGENPAAAFAVGVEPARVRLAAVLACGALAGLGGAVLSLQQVGTFTDAMTNGRGYIALAAIIVGRWLPGGTLLGCLLFGAADALQLRVQSLRLPVSSYVIQMTPYVVALVVLAGLGRSARLPAALGTPFRRE